MARVLRQPCGKGDHPGGDDLPTAGCVGIGVALQRHSACVGGGAVPLRAGPGS